MTRGTEYNIGASTFPNSGWFGGGRPIVIQTNKLLDEIVIDK